MRSRRTTAAAGTAVCDLVEKPIELNRGPPHGLWGINLHGACTEGLVERGLADPQPDSGFPHGQSFGDHQNRALKEGFAVVDGRGNVTRIDQRTTGDLREEIDKRLGGLDRGLQGNQR